jgi:PAS domain S-box-containing protein
MSRKSVAIDGGPGHWSGDNWRLRAIESAGEGIIITDPHLPDNPIIYVNAGFRKITGYSDAEVLGRNCRFMRGAETDPATTELIRKSLVAAESVTCELVNYRRNGDLFWNRLFITPVFDAVGALTHFVGIQLDVTKLKLAEAVAEASRQRLAASARFAALGQLATGLAHEINNPMTAALLLCNRVHRRLTEWNDSVPQAHEVAALKESVATVEKLCHRVVSIVSGMQLLSGGPLGDHAHSQACLGAVLDLVLDRHRNLIKEAGMEVVIQGDPDQTVQGDPWQLEQVFGNIVVNSVHATEGLPSRRLEIVVALSVGHLTVACSDNAPEISDAIAAMMFVPFFTTKEQGNGTGLGLYISRVICERSGGSLDLYRHGGRNVFNVGLLLFDRDSCGI